MSADETERSLRVVREIYDAVSRGDLEALAARHHPSARWEFNAAARDVPWYEPATGTQQIQTLLSTFSGNATIHAFEARRFVAHGPNVFVEVRVEYTVTKTGQRVDGTQLNWWTLEGGLVTGLRHFEDTAQVTAAWRGRDG